MSTLTLILLAVALGADAFSMCLGVGMSGVSRRQIALISLTVLVFHIFMPLIGFLVGDLAGTYIGRAASFAGALLLIYLGIKMLRDALQRDPENPRVAVVNTPGLMLLAASVSMDALSVGFTLGTQGVNLINAVLVFGFVAGLMTFCGLVLGKFIGRLAGERAQVAGGIILIGIGIKLFF